MTGVLIVDDHPMIRSAVSLLLEGGEFGPATEATDVPTARAAIADVDPDVVILDLAMPGGCGLEILRWIRGQGDNRPVIILTAAIDDGRLADALDLEANGIVMKNADPAHVLECLAAVRAGERWIDPELQERAATAAKRGPTVALSPRERELVNLVGQGLRNREIATELGITEGTVKVYMHSIFEKLGVASRTELALRSRS